MKAPIQTLLLLGVAFGFAAAMQSAEAAQKVRKNETWCLETALGGGLGGGGTVNLCNFETRAQCIASKVTQGDRCDINPILAFEQYRSNHRY
jgi:hypothetical protein